MSTYEFANLTFAESTLAKFEVLKPCRINTYINTGRGHGPVETPKGKVVRVSGDGPLRGAGLSVFVAQVAARGLCGPRPEAFRSVSSPAIRPASIVHRKICAEEVFENEHLHKNGWGVTNEFSLSAGLMVGLQRLTNVLSLCPYAQEVTAPQFGNIPLRVMPAKQFGGHILALTFILPAHYASPMIEIGGDADVIDSDLLDGIVNRIDKLSNRGRRDRGQDLSVPVSVFHTLGLGQSRWRLVALIAILRLQCSDLIGDLLRNRANVVAKCDHLNHPTVLLDQFEFFVRQIARAIHEALHSGVGCRDRRLGEAQNLLKRGGGELGNVDQHAQFVEASDTLLSQDRQSAMFFRGIAERLAGSRRIRPLVVTGVSITKDPDAAFIPFVDLGKVAAQRIGVQQAQHHREFPLTRNAVHIFGRVCQRREIRVLFSNGPDQVELFLRVRSRLGIALRSPGTLRY